MLNTAPFCPAPVASRERGESIYIIADYKLTNVQSLCG